MCSGDSRGGHVSSSERSAQSSTPSHSCCWLKHLPLSAHRGSQSVVVGATVVVVGVIVLVGAIMVVRATVLEDGSAVKRIICITDILTPENVMM